MSKFTPHECVRVVNTNSKLDGRLAFVMGTASHHPEMDYYIIEWWDSLEDDTWPSIVLTEHCLESVING